MIFAGTPPTTAIGGTSFVTTAPAATMAPSPMGYAWGDCCVCPDPHILADHDRGRIGVLAALWIYLVVKSRQYDVVANKSAVSSRNAALVLKVAACAEKYILPFSTSQIKNVFHSCG